MKYILFHDYIVDPVLDDVAEDQGNCTMSVPSSIAPPLPPSINAWVQQNQKKPEQKKKRKEISPLSSDAAAAKRIPMRDSVPKRKRNSVEHYQAGL